MWYPAKLRELGVKLHTLHWNKKKSAPNINLTNISNVLLLIREQDIAKKMLLLEFLWPDFLFLFDFFQQDFLAENHHHHVKNYRMGEFAVAGFSLKKPSFYHLFCFWLTVLLTKKQ